MSDVNEKLAQSLSAETTDLIPHLPYLLQDLWELGSSPSEMIGLLSRHATMAEHTRVLDLGCGKGAVSIQVARTFGCRIQGVDILPAFIEYAKEKAAEYGVAHLCDFQAQDVNVTVEWEKDCDVVILGATGDILGEPPVMLRRIKGMIRAGGWILIDDAFCADSREGLYHTRDQWMHFFQDAGVRLVAEIPANSQATTEDNFRQQACIVRRAEELKAAYPDMAPMFDEYVRSQQAECDEIASELTCVTLLLQVG
jgi:cyclopropane fatty-acyl-phospholipid synthase-like methyltransferase